MFQKVQASEEESSLEYLRIDEGVWVRNDGDMYSSKEVLP